MSEAPPTARDWHHDTLHTDAAPPTARDRSSRGGQQQEPRSSPCAHRISLCVVTSIPSFPCIGSPTSHLSGNGPGPRYGTNTPTRTGQGPFKFHDGSPSTTRLAPPGLNRFPQAVSDDAARGASLNNLTVASLTHL
ncbi:hypothetical protein CSOJ01_07664 [Colletotrichum sojae]|uniref:Uncharacterized protein n=1 Tax=Colletotrichum sojae TaxID=2175907 RepID=A0A8H6J920_9PEZI|nr:hypothetical protein CSOJ01_07664 [Colletotrichum sojae]